MHVRMGRDLACVWLQVVVQRFARHKRERRGDFFPANTVVAQRTQIYLPVPREFSWIQDCFSVGRGFGPLESDVVRARAVAALARDAHYQALWVITVGQRI